MKNKIILKIKHKISRLIEEVKYFFLGIIGKDSAWLFKNRFLRMDANEPISDLDRRKFHLDRYQFVTQIFDDKKFLNVLDAACGTGYGSDLLKTISKEMVLGIDISNQAVDYANRKYGSKCCTFSKVNVLDMQELHDKTFDLIVSFETIEHIANPLKFLENISKLLSPSGYFVVSTPNKWGLTKDHKFDYDYPMLIDHLNTFFVIKKIYSQNSGSDLWVNRGQPPGIIEANENNIEKAECFIAICKLK